MLNVLVIMHVTPMRPMLPTLLFAMFILPVFLPAASAGGMLVCGINGGTCDDWDKAEDGTPNQPDWIEGVYEFDLVDTSTINMEMTWALREFNRSALGLDSVDIDSAWGLEGMSAQDGAPADMIRNYFTQEIGGGVTIKQKLQMEVNDTISELLSSGFGTVNSISSSYVDSINNAGLITTCEDNPAIDSAEEAAIANDVFNPPICFSVTASVSLSTSTFNLGSVDALTLERVYKGLLAMGSDITSGFEVFADPGHEAHFVINPPDYATVLATDATGIPTIRAGTPSYMAAEWTIDNTDAVISGERISRDVSIKVGHRNSTQTSSVAVTSEDKGLDLRVTLDLSDESEAWIEVVAGIHHLDQETMEDWGISLVDVTDNATIPWVTSDGIRMAYHNDIIDLTSFTDNFPMDLVGDSIEDAVPSVGEIVVYDAEWVSDSLSIGMPEPSGGLNHTHDTCPESLPPGTDAYYCVQGPNAMDGSSPIYLRAYSESFDLHLLDIIKQEVGDTTGFLDAIQEQDLQRLLEAGLSIETEFGPDLLRNMIPDDMPPTEMTLELVLPQWMSSATGQSSIKLVERTVGEDQLGISMSSPPGEGYDPRHAIYDEDGEEICSAHVSDWSCVDFDMELEVSDVNINEWGPSAEMTIAFSAGIDIYRIKVPNMVRENMSSGNNSVDIEVISSDLLRLGLDISGRLLEPRMTDFELGDDNLSVVLTKGGIEDMVDEIGIRGTKIIHDLAEELSDANDSIEVDLSGIQIITELSIGNIGASIGDDVPISMKLTIPEFTIAAGVTNGWGGISDGEPTIGIATSFASPITQMLTDFSRGITSVGKQLVSLEGSGINLHQDEQPFEFQIEERDLVIHEESNTELRGEFTITMPGGIVLEEFQSANGWEDVGEDEDGRQQIKIDIESFAQGDEFNFKVSISWGFILGQIWAYPAVVMGLMIWRIRARRKKKRKKQDAKFNKRSMKKFEKKGGLSSTEFAMLGRGEEASSSFGGGPGAGPPPVPDGLNNDLDIYSDDIWNYP